MRSSQPVSLGIAALSLALALPCGPARGQAQLPEKAAVIDFETQGGVSSRMARVLSDTLREHFARTKQYDIMTREEMEAAFRKKGIRIAESTSSESIFAAGKAIGVRRVFAGSVGKGGDSYYVTLSLYWTDTREIEPIGVDRCPLCPEDALVDSLERLAAKMAEEDRTATETRAAPGKTDPKKAAP